MLLVSGAHARMTYDCAHIAAGCMLRCNRTIALTYFLCVTATNLDVSQVLLRCIRLARSIAITPNAINQHLHKTMHSFV